MFTDKCLVDIKKQDKEKNKEKITEYHEIFT